MKTLVTWDFSAPLGRMGSIPWTFEGYRTGQTTLVLVEATLVESPGKWVVYTQIAEMPNTDRTGFFRAVPTGVGKARILGRAVERSLADLESTLVTVTEG